MGNQGWTTAIRNPRLIGRLAKGIIILIYEYGARARQIQIRDYNDVLYNSNKNAYLPKSRASLSRAAGFSNIITTSLLFIFLT